MEKEIEELECTLEWRGVLNQEIKLEKNQKSLRKYEKKKEKYSQQQEQIAQDMEEKKQEAQDSEVWECSVM